MLYSLLMVGDRTKAQRGFALVGAVGAGAVTACALGVHPLVGAVIALFSSLIDRVKEVALKHHPLIAANWINYEEDGEKYRIGAFELRIPRWRGVGRYTARHCFRLGVEVGKAWVGSCLASISFPQAWVIGAVANHGERLGISLYECGFLFAAQKC